MSTIRRHPSPLPPRRHTSFAGSPLPPDPAGTGKGSPLPPNPRLLAAEPPADSDPGR
jgi:hypothetical protein